MESPTASGKTLSFTGPMPGNALMRYIIPMPDDSRIPGKDAEEMALNGSVLSTVKNGGPKGTELRTFRWAVSI